MKDTSSEIRKKQLEILLSKTETERFIIGDELTSFGREILAGEIRRKNPGISDTDLKLEIFRRCYSGFYSEDEMKKILESMKIYLLQL